jgi:hypothetical protein
LEEAAIVLEVAIEVVRGPGPRPPSSGGVEANAGLGGQVRAAVGRAEEVRSMAASLGSMLGPPPDPAENRRDETSNVVRLSRGL